jgi:hypothetical protein
MGGILACPTNSRDDTHKCPFLHLGIAEAQRARREEEETYFAIFAPFAVNILS